MNKERMKPPAGPKKYQSYALTVRPRDGATGFHDQIMSDFVKKYCEYYFVVSEKLDSDRHLHAGLFLKKATSRSDLCCMIKRAYRMLDDDEKRVLVKGVRIMYNMDFIENYLDKDDDTEEVLKNLPEANFLEGYWPPTSDQMKAKAEQAVDKYYAKLEYLWYQYQNPGVEVNYQSVCMFLSRMMNAEREIRVIADDRKLKQTAMALARYIRKDVSYVVALASRDRDWETDW